MPSLLDGITTHSGLLDFLNPEIDSSTPSAADALARVRATLLPHQLAFCDDITHRKIGLVCGFGAGKTHGLVAKAVTLAAQNIGYASALFEPVAPMLRDILERTFDDLLTEWEIPFTFRVSPLPEYTLTFAEGQHTILLRTMETWNRIRGQNLCAIGFDEADTAPQRVAENAARMALARLRAGHVRQFYAATTPEGFGWAYQTFKRDAKDDTRLIQARTADNPHLPDDFIPSLIANYPANLIQAYLNGEFVSLTTGTVYDRFNRNRHVVPIAIEDDETILMGCDFNVGNTNAVLGVRRGRELFIIDEIAAAHDTDALGKELRRRHPYARVLGYPDASGRNRSTNSSRSDIAILQSYDISNMAPAANPPIRDRVASVQALLENGNGETRLWIDPRCRKLIECLELQSYTDKGEPDKQAGYDHMCFAADTLVRTPDGLTTIALLPSSGKIMGPFGTWVSYRNACKTGAAQTLLSVLLSDGSVVRCTPEHQWLTQEGQWVQASWLTPGTRLMCQRSLVQPSKSFAAKLTTSAASTFSAMVAACIALSGKPSMGRSLTAAMFIIGTAIAQTITQATWSCSRLLSTYRTTVRRQQRIALPGGTTALGNGLKLLLLNGTAAKLAGNGIGFSTAEWLPSSMSARVAPSSATPAARISTRSTIALGSAARHARLLTGAVQALTTLSDPAHSATQPSSSTATPARNAAPGAVASGTGISVVALWSSPPADVYCLSSELGSFALACGPVVSNCDALGYMCHRLFEVGRPTAGRAVRGVRLY